MTGKKLTLSVLALLVLGFGARVLAVRLDCTECFSNDTYAIYKCDVCTEPREWELEAQGDDPSGPPWDSECPWCTTVQEYHHGRCGCCMTDPIYW